MSPHRNRFGAASASCTALIALGLLVAGCQPLSLAGVAASLIAGGDGSDIVTNPMDRAPPRDLHDQLANMPDRVDPACEQALDAARETADDETGGTVPAAGREIPAPHACRVQPVCLPGTPEPVQMMVCPSGQDVAARATSARGANRK